jgi:hypothetical protein
MCAPRVSYKRPTKHSFWISEVAASSNGHHLNVSASASSTHVGAVAAKQDRGAQDARISIFSVNYQCDRTSQDLLMDAGLDAMRGGAEEGNRWVRRKSLWTKTGLTPCRETLLNL